MDMDSFEGINHFKAFEVELSPEATLCVKETDTDIQLELRTDKDGNSKHIDVASLTRDISFIDDEVFIAFIDDREIGFKLDDMKNPRNIFSIFHEMGHIRVVDKRGKKYRAETKRIRNTIPTDWSPHDASLMIEDERAAWAEAIGIARRLRDEHGINLFSVFKSPGDFMGWLRTFGLRGYEAELAKYAGPGVYTKNTLVERWTVKTPLELLSSDELAALNNLIPS